MRVKPNFFLRLGNVEDKVYQYQNDKCITELSAIEKRIVKMMTDDLKNTLHLTEDETCQIYLMIKRLILASIRRGHCELPWLDIELMWKDHDGIFAKLHAIPLEDFKNYIEKMSDIIKTLDRKTIEQWIEF